jgi:hypothetical protein
VIVRLAYLLPWVFISLVPWEGVIRIGGVSVASRLTGVVALAITLLAVLFTGRLRRFDALQFATIALVFTAGFELLLMGGNNKLPGKYCTLATLLLFRSQAGILRRFAMGGVDSNDLAMTLALARPMAWYSRPSASDRSCACSVEPICRSASWPWVSPAPGAV